MVIIEAHLFSQFLSYGIEEQSAAWAFGVYGIATICGAMASGILCNHLHKGKCWDAFMDSVLYGYPLLIPPTQDTLYSGSICNRPGTDRRCYGIPYIRHRKRYIYDEKVATLIGFLFFCHQIGAFSVLGWEASVWT